MLFQFKKPRVVPQIPVKFDPGRAPIVVMLEPFKVANPEEFHLPISPQRGGRWYSVKMSVFVVEFVSALTAKPVVAIPDEQVVRAEIPAASVLPAVMHPATDIGQPSVNPFAATLLVALGLNAVADLSAVPIDA